MYVHIYLHVSYYYWHIKFTRVNYLFHIYILISSRSQEFDLTGPIYFSSTFMPSQSHILLFIISLQLKNHIAALYSEFKKTVHKNLWNWWDSGFGWRAIEDQYNRDRLGADQGCVPRALGLWYNFVYRDVWTRLNVLPA